MYNQPNQFQQPTYEQQPYAQPQWGQQPPPYYGQPQQPPKRRRRWLWILAIVVGVLLLAIVGGIAALVLTVNNSPASAVSQQYYNAIKSQDYATAYSYLDPTIKLTSGGQTQQINEQLFTQSAQGYDQTKGKVSDYSITGINLSSSTDTGNTANVTVRVTRNTNSYDVHLQLKQEGNDWKIIGFDSL